MATHPAVVIVGAGRPLEIHQLPTPSPQDDEVKVRVEWTASTPLDLHQADGGLLVNPPHVMGSSAAGTVVAIGPSVTLYQPGDKVFGYGFRKRTEKAHQLYSVAPQTLWGRVPDGFSLQQAVTLPNNFVSVYHTLTSDLGLDLPWPKPDTYQPRDLMILIWGGSSSCGMFAIQLLKYFGYNNVITTASRAHHDRLRAYGAAACFDYRTDDVVSSITEYSTVHNKPIRLVFDCIGSLTASVTPVSHIASGAGTKIAILLPIITRDSAAGVTSEYTFDATGCVQWADGVQAVGVRTHFYMKNEVLARDLQAVIMPAALAQGVVEPNEQTVVEGATLLERAEKALDLLRRKQVSGGRLVWRVAEPVE